MRTEGGIFKVLHIIHGFGTGGAETWLLAILRYLKGKSIADVEMHFLATGGEKLTYDEEVLRVGGKIHYVRFSINDLPGFRSSFKKLLQQERFNAIHDHQDFVSGIHYLLGLGELPDVCVSHLHNPLTFADNYLSSFKRRFTYRSGRMLMACLATHITGTSEQVMDDYGYHKWPFVSKRIPAIYCGIDVASFSYSEEEATRVRQSLGIEENNRVCLFAGRIGIDDFPGAVNQKNPDFALRIAIELVTKYPAWIFLFAGYKGKVGAAMEREVEQRGLSERIKFLGVRKDMPALMSSANAFVFPSFMEGLGMVMVEAQANGLPVFASENVPREAMVINEMVSFLDLSKGCEYWAEKISKSVVLTREERLNRNTRIADSRFSIANSVQALLDVYGYGKIVR